MDGAGGEPCSPGAETSGEERPAEPRRVWSAEGDGEGGAEPTVAWGPCELTPGLAGARCRARG